MDLQTEPSRPDDHDEQRIVTCELEVLAPAAVIFELVADPAQQPRWDGNDNLGRAPAGQRIHHVGECFRMELTKGSIRENEVVEFSEGRLVAWKPSPVGEPQPGHLWRWELEPRGPRATLVRHTYDWTGLVDQTRMPRARATGQAQLMASLVRLKELAERLADRG